MTREKKMEQVVVTEGSRLETTQKGTERKRFAKLYGIFMEEIEGQMRLVVRNFPSQRIMKEWLERTGWTTPEKKASYIIFHGKPKSGLRVFSMEEMAAAPILEAVSTVTSPTTPRAPAASKPAFPALSETSSDDLHEEEEDLDEDLVDEEGKVSL